MSTEVKRFESLDTPFTVALTVTSPVNIAVIKYWGKRDVALNLPCNSSLSGTLDQADLRTETSVAFLSAGKSDALILNGEEQDITNSKIQCVLRLLRERGVPELATRPVLITSNNNFPTAAGLASSASGYCAMVFALGKLLQVQGEITDVGRQGSGSATRSFYGGFVSWEMGTDKSGCDSIAAQVVDEKHWEDMEILILVACADKKEVPSSSGMQQTVKTCPMMEERIKIVPERMEIMKKAIIEKDFKTFAELTMLDSDHFHELCHTTVPAIRYMNEISHNVVRLVKEFNKETMRAAYTFDAGPNAVIYLPKANVKEFLALSLHFFPPTNDENFLNNATLLQEAKALEISTESYSSIPVMANGLNNIIYTKIGGGPVITSLTNKLID